MALTNIKIYKQAVDDTAAEQMAQELRKHDDAIVKSGVEARSEHSARLVALAVAIKRAGYGAPWAAEKSGLTGASQPGHPNRNRFQRHFTLAGMIVKGAVKEQDAVRLVIETGLEGAVKALRPPKPDKTTEQAIEASLQRAVNAVVNALTPGENAGYTAEDLAEYLEAHSDTRKAVAERLATAADMVSNPESLMVEAEAAATT